MPATYKIPQNVDLEDKIIGPLTLKQFLYTLGAGMVTFVSFSVFYQVAAPLFYIITIFTWIFTAALVFVRPNDQPFTKFLFSFLWFTIKPNRRVWKRIPSLGEITLSDSTKKAAPEPDAPSAEQVKSHLQQLAHVVDTRGWSELDDGVGERVVSSGAAKPRLNIVMSDMEEPDDILAAEDENRGSDRATAELDRMLRRGVAKPEISKSPAPAAPHAAPVITQHGPSQAPTANNPAGN